MSGQEQGVRVFDWDRDYSELVEEPKACVVCAQTEGAAPKVEPPLQPRPVSSRILPLILAAVFIAGLAYEKADVARSVLPFGFASVADSSTFGVGANAPEADAIAIVDTLPPELMVYELAQYQRFMLGLQRMTLPELQSYAQKTRSDLDAAPVALAPFYIDALFLLEREVLQRGS